MNTQSVTPDGFRNIEKPFVFVAGSRDVTDHRRAAYYQILEVLSDFGLGNECTPFMWDTEHENDPFSQSRSMQKHLPRPASDHCRGIIAVLGERIGFPLEQSFDLRLLHDHEKWTGLEEVRLLHPDWPADPEKALRLVKEGFYPLTGTVFEVLDALGSARPVLLVLAAEREISLDGDNITLNGWKYYKRVLEGTSSDKKSDWDRLYDIQVGAVHNFVRAISKRLGRAQLLVQTPADTAGYVQRFVRWEVIAQTVKAGNPYRFLEYFDLKHRDNFYGRGTWVENSIKALVERYRAHEPATMRIVGPSGCGKTSVLRAGMLAELERSSKWGRHICVAVRPEDLLDADGRPKDVVPHLLEIINEKHESLGLTLREVGDVRRAGAAAARRAAELLAAKLTKLRPQCRLVLGLDQFEEIVDTVSARGRGHEEWRSLISFVEWAARTERITAIYTLESSRKEAHKYLFERSRREAREHLPLGSAFGNAIERPLDDFSTDFLQGIIDEPFRRAGYRLSRKTVEKLTDSLRAIRPDDDANVRDAVLPLLALKLSELYDDVADRYQPEHMRHHLAFLGGSEDGGIPPEQLDLEFSSIIERQAQRAWARAQPNTPVTLGNLDHFLLPFVNLRDGQIQLPVVTRTRSYPDEDKLAKAFRDCRLMVDSGNDGLRLVHQAVLRYWPDAWNWYEKRRDYLRREEWVRLDAESWEAKGRRSSDLRSEINDVTEVLQAYFRNWANPSAPITRGESLFKSYCLAIFRKSETPGAKVEGSVHLSSAIHVTLAAWYGLIDLLKRFQGIDQGCLNRPNVHSSTGTWPLGTAAWYHPEAVSFLLAQHVDPVAKNQEGWPAICAPINTGDLQTFLSLLGAVRARFGEDIREVLACPDGGTLVHWAAHFDRRSMLDVLLAHGFSPDAVGARERRPLHYAAASGAEDAFDYLLTKADVTARCNFGTCLHVAAAYGHSAIVYRILKSADRDHLLHEKDHEGRTALHTAAAYRKPVCVRVLLQFFDPNEPDLSGRAPLHLAVARKGELVEDEDILTTLEALFEDPRVDVNVPDKDGNTALASADGRRTVQKALLDRKDLDLAAAISKGGEPAYALAARLGHWAAIRRYLKDNPIPTEADLDGRGNSFVHLLANRNSPMDLLPDRLEDLGIENLNTRNADGRTPLRVAIAHKNWPIADRLLHSEAVSIEDGDAFSLAREILVSADTTRFLEVLGRRYPATLVAKSELGGTILHYTCGHQHDLGIEQLRAAIADRPDLWNEIDRLKRRPVDLLRPSARDRIPDADNAAPWPEPRSWDSGLVWREPEALLREALGEKCSSGDGKYAVSNATRIEVTNLAFYPQEATLLRLTDLGWKEPNLAIYYLAHEKNLFRLDGTSPPIKQINAESISLTSANALEYLRFFCFFVRGDEGPFLIVESAGQYELPAYLNAKDAKRLGELAHPAWYNGFVDETHYASALIYYSNALFGADFRINSAGMIEMIDDFPLANDMSAKIACPIG